jgi:hypothetical protein
MRTSNKIKTGFVLFLFWLIALSVNLFKPVHMDDTVHLEAAKWILKNPLHPMSYTIDWGTGNSPGHTYNNPPLLLYFLALCMNFFGDSEVMLHAAYSVFALAAIILFFLTASSITTHALKLTALFALCPAFLVSQNLMLDLPLTVFWLLITYLIVHDIKKSSVSYKFPFLIGLVLGLSILIKYTSLALFPVYVFYLIKRYQWKGLLFLIVPVSIIAFWSIFNILEYGGVHILRNNQSPEPYHFINKLVITGIKPLLWLVGLGSTAIYALWSVKLVSNRKILILALLSIVITTAGFYARGWIQVGLGSIFLFAGSLLTMVSLYAYLSCRKDIISQIFALAHLSVMLFIIALAPFMAIRHLLPALPFLLFLIAYGKMEKGIIKILPIIINAFLGIGLAYSDQIYAETYKSAALKIHEKCDPNAHETIWFTGHWGFQWYAQKAGMKPFESFSTMQPGDYFADLMLERDSPSIYDSSNGLTLIDSIVFQSNWGTWLRTMSPMGFYLYSREVPWTITIKPLVKFNLYRVNTSAGDRGNNTLSNQEGAGFTRERQLIYKRTKP